MGSELGRFGGITLDVVITRTIVELIIGTRCARNELEK